MFLRLPPLNAVRAFEAAARNGSVTRAAAELRVSHSAVTRQVKLLEAFLGTAHFAKAGRGLRSRSTASATSAPAGVR